MVEAFWATLKRELAGIHGTTTWTTRAELRSAVFDYIEGFYNPNRIQRRLGHWLSVTRLQNARCAALGGLAWRSREYSVR